MNAEEKSVEAVLGELATRLNKIQKRKRGVISFTLSGPGGGDYFLDCLGESVLLKRGQSPNHIFEVSGDAQRISSIISGKKDAVAQFKAGGINVRGDLKYFSDLAFELGIVKEPLFVSLI